MQKLYCYVDETGQDTKGELFLVSVIITEKEQEKLRYKLNQIEERSRKKNAKWIKTKKEVKEKYLSEIFNSNLLKNKIFYAQYSHTKTYIDLTILSVAKAILRKADKKYTSNVYIDGLPKSQTRKFGAGLRKLNIKVRKVRGVKDQSEILIRLADSIVGFVRDHLEKEKYTYSLYSRAIRNKIIQELK